MSNKTYMEDQTLTIPILDNDVMNIGDLWDCRESETVKGNLFNEQLKEECVYFIPIESLEYKLTHYRSRCDEFESMNLSREVTLELEAGLIQLKCSNQDYPSYEERIICHFLRETSSFHASTILKKKINELIVKKILEKEIKPTHFVSGIILGVEVRANIFLTQLKSSKSDEDDDFISKLIFGTVNSSVTSKLELLDSDSRIKKEIDIISVNSECDKPKSFHDMFKKIANIVEDELITPKGQVLGKPIRFILTPINQFVSAEIQRNYIKIPDELFENARNLITLTHDLQKPFYFHGKIRKTNLVASLIARTSNFEFPGKMIEFEKKIQELGKIYSTGSRETMRQYKKGSIRVNQINYLYRLFINKCDSSIFVKVKEFINDSEGELCLTFIFEKSTVMNGKTFLVFYMSENN